MPGWMDGLDGILREIVENRMTSSSLSSAVATRAFPFFVFVFEMRKTAGRAGVGVCVFGFGHVSGRGRAHWTSK